MEDHSLYIIKAQRILNRIHEESNARRWETAYDYAYALSELTAMLGESLKAQENKEIA